MSKNIKCIDCKYSIQQDYGYSNYTVEGTEIDCLLNKNKQFPTDRFYGEEPSLLYASKCSFFKEGDGPEFDVDGEYTIDDYKDDEEIYSLLKIYFSGD